MNLTIVNSEISIRNNISNLSEEEFIEERSQNVQKFVDEMFPNNKIEENYKNTLIFFVNINLNN